MIFDSISDFKYQYKDRNFSIARKQTHIIVLLLGIHPSNILTGSVCVLEVAWRHNTIIRDGYGAVQGGWVQWNWQCAKTLLCNSISVNKNWIDLLAFIITGHIYFEQKQQQWRGKDDYAVHVHNCACLTKQHSPFYTHRTKLTHIKPYTNTCISNTIHVVLD